MKRDDLRESLFLYWGKSAISTFVAFLVVSTFLFAPVAIWLDLASGSVLPIRILVGLGVVWGLAIGLAVLVGSALAAAGVFSRLTGRRAEQRDRKRLDALMGDAPTLPADAWGEEERDE